MAISQYEWVPVRENRMTYVEDNYQPGHNSFEQMMFIFSCIAMELFLRLFQLISLGLRLSLLCSLVLRFAISFKGPSLILC